MTKYQKVSLLLTRLALGWLFFYAGITKLIAPAWSAAFYLKDPQMFAGFYKALLNPGALSVVNFLVAWGLTLLGVSLILGIFVRLSSYLGALLMLLLYFPILKFPYPNAHSFIVDEHIIYGLVLIFFAAIRAGRVYGLDAWCARLPWCAQHPRVRDILG